MRRPGTLRRDRPQNIPEQLRAPSSKAVKAYFVVLRLPPLYVKVEHGSLEIEGYAQWFGGKYRISAIAKRFDIPHVKLGLPWTLSSQELFT